MDFDYWLNWFTTKHCNLKCEFCIIKDEANYNYNPEINVTKFLKTLDSFGKTFYITFSGGEPFLIPNVIETMKAVSKHHFISVNTNLICDNVKEFVNEIDPNRVREIIAAFHIKELENNNLIEKFIENFKLCGKFNIRAISIAHPPLISKAKYYIDYLSKHNIELKFEPFFGEFENKKYPESYSDVELDVFQMSEEKRIKFSPYGKMCNAGKNAVMVLPDGEVVSCAGLGIKMGNVYDKIEFKKDLIKCPNGKCECPFYLFEPELFKKA